MKTFAAVLLVVVALFSVTAGAGQVWWGNANITPHGGNGDWATAINWGTQVLPGSGDSVGINSNGTPYPTVSSAVGAVTDVEIAYWADGGLTIDNGGQLPVSNLFSVGYVGANWNGAFSNATLTMTGGEIGSLADTNYDPAQMWIGYTNTSNGAHYGSNGTVNMSGGRIDVRWALNVGGGLLPTVGHLNISGGQLNLWQMLNVASGSNIDISGTGTLALWNKWGGGKSLADIQAMINSGLITGNGVVGNIKITNFDNADGGTGFGLTALPEPATMVLLGIGGLAFIRRK